MCQLQVPTACWDNPTDTEFIQNQKLDGVKGLFSYWVKRVHEIAKSLGRRVIMWDAAFNSGSEPPPKDVVIQMWLQYGNQNTLLQEIVNAGCVLHLASWQASLHFKRTQTVLFFTTYILPVADTRFNTCWCCSQQRTFCVLQILGDCVTRRALVPQRRRAQRRTVQHAVAVHLQLRLTRRSSSVSSITRPGRGGLPVGRDCRLI